MPKKLTARQLKIRVFANEYVRDFNGARAAAVAGWSEKRAAATASELLDDPECQAEIEKVMQQREQRSRVKAFKVLDNLAPLIESNLEHYMVDERGNVTVKADAPADAMLAVSKIKRRIRHSTKPNGEGVTEIDVEIALWDKNAALGNAMKHLGMMKDRVEHTGANGAPLDLTVRFVRPEPKT